MENRTKLQSLCETRWAARADALNTFKCSYTTVVDSLDDINLHYGDAKAWAYRDAITQFGFIFGLVAIEHVLSGLVPLSQMLQNKTCDLVEAVKEPVRLQRNETTELYGMPSMTSPSTWPILLELNHLAQGHTTIVVSSIDKMRQETRYRITGDGTYIYRLLIT